MDELIPYGLTEEGITAYLAALEGQRTSTNLMGIVASTDSYVNDPNNADPEVAQAYVLGSYGMAIAAIPEGSDIEPTDDYVNGIIQDSLIASGNAGAFIGSTTVDLYNYLDSEANALAERLLGGDPYTYPTEEEIEQFTGEIPEEFDFLFNDPFMLVDPEGAPVIFDLGGGGGVDPGNPGGGSFREETVNSLRPEDNTGGFYFDVLAYSDGADLVAQVADDYMANSLQGTPLYEALILGMTEA